MRISPDEWVFWSWRGFDLNATIVFTWGVMALLTLGAFAITRRLRDDEHLSRWQNLMEVLVTGLDDQIAEVSQQRPGRYRGFIGTLFLFIFTSNVLAVVPGFEPPTGSLATTTGLAICVLVAVPLYGIAERGLGRYLGSYLKPTAFMLPFNIIGEISRTVALAVRLYGNIMSGTVIVGILLSVVPFVFPVVMQLLGLLTGVIQAYIFSVLAMVYIASATRTHGGGTEAEADPADAPSPASRPDQE